MYAPLGEYVKLLKWDSKHDEQFWDISAPALEDKAYKELFKIMDDDGYYCDISTSLEEVSLAKTDLEALKKHMSTFVFKDDLLKSQFNSFIESKLDGHSYLAAHELETQSKLYAQAKTGSVRAMIRLIHLRSDKDYEYEKVRTVTL